MEEMIKLTNGKKTIIRSKIQYEANVAHFKMRGFTPLDEVKKEIKKATVKDITDKVVQLKPKKKQGKRNEKLKKILEDSKR
jgi:hypothetical protein